jgi:outer membrane protein OmpA-like peptidoglycan-associated protein
MSLRCPHRSVSVSRSRAPMWIVLLLTILGAAHVAVAQFRDVKGSRDHPMISRYAGSVVIGYDLRKFDEIVLPLGPVRKEGNKIVPTKSQRLEGQVTRILYLSPEGRSSLEVLRNYEQELKKSGFSASFTCAGVECGVEDGSVARYLYPPERQLKDTPPDGSGRPAGQISEHAFHEPRSQRYLVAKRTDPKGDVYASVYVADQGWDFHTETYKRVMVLLDVVNLVPMDTGLVTVSAAAMAKDINATGHIALYGILFDTDKADVKPESEPMLQEIAQMMKTDAALKLYVVGHTDNVGGFDYNMGLAQRRAASVVKELTTRHGIPAARLRPGGVGLLAPVASNDTEEGRAKNRRVELVKQ